MQEGPRLQVDVKHPRCPYCREDVSPDQPKSACTACMGWLHAACAAEAGGRCPACGAELPGPPPPSPDPARAKPLQGWWLLPGSPPAGVPAPRSWVDGTRSPDAAPGRAHPHVAQGAVAALLLVVLSLKLYEGALLYLAGIPMALLLVRFLRSESGLRLGRVAGSRRRWRRRRASGLAQDGDAPAPLASPPPPGKDDLARDLPAEERPPEREPSGPAPG